MLVNPNGGSFHKEPDEKKNKRNKVGGFSHKK